MNVAVVGAGVSGLIAARLLLDRNLDVTVFDKGRRPGGRASSRRSEAGHLDHGAQYFTVRDPRFASRVVSWERDGVVARWQGGLVTIGPQGLEAFRDEKLRYVGTPSMRAISEHLSRDLDVRQSIRIASLVKDQGDETWSLRADAGRRFGPFDLVLVSTPAPQAVPLLAAAPELVAKAKGAVMTPCHAVMAIFERPLELGFDGAFVEGEGPLGWVSRNTSKPGRSPVEAWILHSTPCWSQANFGAEADEVSAALLQALGDLLGRHLPEPRATQAHRWGFAGTRSQVPSACLFDESGVGACGDWCAGGRVEGAFLSGSALAGRALSWLSTRGGESGRTVSVAPSPEPRTSPAQSHPLHE